MIRSRAKEWGVDAKRLGILGFSAGGHLAAATSTNYETRTYPEVDAADKESCRPDFQALIYSGPLGIVRQPVSKETPPTFILVGDDDKAATWLVEHYQALKKVGAI